MEISKNEITELINTVAASDGSELMSLNDLQLALVGGGIADVIAG